MGLYILLPRGVGGGDEDLGSGGSGKAPWVTQQSWTV